MDAYRRKIERDKFTQKTGLDPMARTAEDWMNMSIDQLSMGLIQSSKDCEDAMNLRLKVDNAQDN